MFLRRAKKKVDGVNTPHIVLEEVATLPLPAMPHEAIPRDFWDPIKKITPATDKVAA